MEVKRKCGGLTRYLFDRQNRDPSNRAYMHRLWLRLPEAKKETVSGRENVSF